MSQRELNLFILQQPCKFFLFRIVKRLLHILLNVFNGDIFSFIKVNFVFRSFKVVLLYFFDNGCTKTSTSNEFR